MDTVAIRRAEASDYEGIADLFAEGDMYHHVALPDLFPPPDPRSPEFLAALLPDPSAALFVAEIQGRLVGLVHVSVHEAGGSPFQVARRIAFVQNLVVTTAHRRRGIGTALMERAKLWSLERGARDVELNVFEFNKAALQFYEKLGYQSRQRRMVRGLP